MLRLSNRNRKAIYVPPDFDEECLFEIVNGTKVALPNMSAYSSQIAQWFFQALYDHIDQMECGTMLMHALFGTTIRHDPDRQRRPNVSYISKERWPIARIPPDSDPWPTVPNLTVEVISPKNRIVEVDNKISDYFEAGVELVWVVHPKNEMVEVYTAPLQSTKLSKSETLTGGSVLPGFELKLATIFRS